MRGVLYSLAKYKNIENNRISIIKTSNPEEFLKANKIASSAYMFIGAVFSVMFLILNICYPIFFREHFVLSILGIFLLDFLCGILVNVRLQLDKHFYNNENKEEED